MTPDELRDRLPDFALGLLREDQAAEVVKFLRGNAAARAEVRLYQQATDALALSAPPVPPLPADVIEGIRAFVHEEGAGESVRVMLEEEAARAERAESSPPGGRLLRRLRPLRNRAREDAPAEGVAASGETDRSASGPSGRTRPAITLSPMKSGQLPLPPHPAPTSAPPPPNGTSAPSAPADDARPEDTEATATAGPAAPPRSPSEEGEGPGVRADADTPTATPLTAEPPPAAAEEEGPQSSPGLDTAATATAGPAAAPPSPSAEREGPGVGADADTATATPLTAEPPPAAAEEEGPQSSPGPDTAGTQPPTAGPAALLPSPSAEGEGPGVRADAGPATATPLTAEPPPAAAEEEGPQSSPGLDTGATQPPTAGPAAPPPSPSEEGEGPGVRARRRFGRFRRDKAEEAPGPVSPPAVAAAPPLLSDTPDLGEADAPAAAPEVAESTAPDTPEPAADEATAALPAEVEDPSVETEPAADEATVALSPEVEDRTVEPEPAADEATAALPAKVEDRTVEPEAPADEATAALPAAPIPDTAPALPLGDDDEDDEDEEPAPRRRFGLFRRKPKDDAADEDEDLDDDEEWEDDDEWEDEEEDHGGAGKWKAATALFAFLALGLFGGVVFTFVAWHNAQVEADAARLELDRRAIEFEFQPGDVPIGEDGQQPFISGSVFITNDKRDALLMLFSLPANKPGETFQLWGKREDGEVFPWHTFTSRGESAYLARVRSTPAGAIELFLTVEPQRSGNDPLPSTPTEPIWAFTKQVVSPP